MDSPVTTPTSTSADLLAWDHWHMELSSICALRCPRCPRAEVPETLLNRQLTLQFFQQRIGADVVRQIRKFTFCGNDGDPIYCRDLIDIVSWIKSVNSDVAITIITNGSHRPASWWQSLAAVLDRSDELHWSLDGWDQHSNEQYRIGSDWSSIISGIQAFRSHNQDTYLVWAAIAFRFNQDHLDRQQQMARDLGFDLYQLTKSTKFHDRYPMSYPGPDALQPRSDLMAAGDRFERTHAALTAKSRPGQELKMLFRSRAQDLLDGTTYPGLCRVGNKGVFVNSSAEFYPCCWTANRYAHNANWHQLAASRFNLNHHTWTEIISDPFWQEQFLTVPEQECKNKCTRSKLTDPEHVTEW